MPTGQAPTKLLLHQAAFVETFFDPGSKRVTMLRADVGLGKTLALVALSARRLNTHPTSRVLFLVPSPIRTLVVDMLRDAFRAGAEFGSKKAQK